MLDLDLDLDLDHAPDRDSDIRRVGDVLVVRVAQSLSHAAIPEIHEPTAAVPLWGGVGVPSSGHREIADGAG